HSVYSGLLVEHGWVRTLPLVNRTDKGGDAAGLGFRLIREEEDYGATARHWDWGGSPVGKWGRCWVSFHRAVAVLLVGMDLSIDRRRPVDLVGNGVGKMEHGNRCSNDALKSVYMLCI
ncbi:hypothetical protein ACLOJK_017657, partial [Asimina triloba]